MQIIKKDSLSTVMLNGEVGAYVLDGSTHGISTSAFIVDVPPDLGPRRHKHPYEEIFIIVEGSVRLEADGETRDVGPDDICVVPAEVPHAFTNIGPGRARMVNIHAAPKVVTEFVAGGPENGQYQYNHSS